LCVGIVVYEQGEMNMFRHAASALDFCEELTDLITDQSEWSQRTFGVDAERGPIGALKHLEKEAKEAQQAVGTDELVVELADCFLLLLDATRRSGFKLDALIEAAQAKMEINKQRDWPKPTSDEPVEHIH
jgi:hypothetical protein